MSSFLRLHSMLVLLLGIMSHQHLKFNVPGLLFLYFQAPSPIPLFSFFSEWHYLEVTFSLPLQLVRNSCQFEKQIHPGSLTALCLRPSAPTWMTAATLHVASTLLPDLPTQASGLNDPTVFRIKISTLQHGIPGDSVALPISHPCSVPYSGVPKQALLVYVALETCSRGLLMWP